MFDYTEFVKELEELKKNGLLNRIRTLESPQGAWLLIEGKKVLNMCSNNYLGLAFNDQMKEAAIEAIKKWGVGPGAVRTIAGTLKIHSVLEKELAAFKKVEASLVLQSGFNANQAVVPALLGENDAVLSDELNHASIIDAVRLCRAKRYIWKHRDIKSLEEKLDEAAAAGARKMLVVTDGVFSMDGDLAPLPEIATLCERQDTLLMVDDAHGEGVLGEKGRGIVDHFGLHGKVDIEVGTLSKAFGVVGGFVAAKMTLIDYLKQKARPFLFSSSLSPAETGAALAAVRLLADSDEHVKKLWHNTGYFQSRMIDTGFELGATRTPITPVMLYDAKLSSTFSSRLFEEGLFAQSIGFPTVPKGKERIRVMISAAHSESDLDFALERFRKVGIELGILS